MAAMKVAVIGTGIAGLAAAHRLRLRTAARVTLEAGEHSGSGHKHTVDLTPADPDGRRVTHGVDTGFLVYNERTYPTFVELFAYPDIATAASDISSAPRP
jgi:uncharacterized protein